MGLVGEPLDDIQELLSALTGSNPDAVREIDRAALRGLPILDAAIRVVFAPCSLIPEGSTWVLRSGAKAYAVSSQLRDLIEKTLDRKRQVLVYTMSAEEQDRASKLLIDPVHEAWVSGLARGAIIETLRHDGFVVRDH